MIDTQRTFRTEDGLDLAAHEWGPDGDDARACLVVVHGFSEHGGRYAGLAAHLAAAGITTCAYDQRGHGRSPGQRGHVRSFDEYRRDLAAFVERARAARPETPVFLLGHSMGALIVLDQAVRDPLGAHGVVASGAPVVPGEVAGAARVALARAMSRIWPRFTLSLKIDPEAVSGDPDASRAYRDDPLVHGRATARWGTELLAAIDRVRATVGEIRLPLLLVHGEDDPLALVEGARGLAEIASGAAEVTLRTYPGARHEPHNDVVRAQVAADIAAWIGACA